MSSINDGGPAFPLAPDRWTDMEGVRHMSQACGMSLRDWFAGQALSGSVSRRGDMHPADVACDCYRYADAMLAARDGAK